MRKNTPAKSHARPTQDQSYNINATQPMHPKDLKVNPKSMQINPVTRPMTAANKDTAKFYINSWLFTIGPGEIVMNLAHGQVGLGTENQPVVPDVQLVLSHYAFQQFATVVQWHSAFLSEAYPEGSPGIEGMNQSKTDELVAIVADKFARAQKFYDDAFAAAAAQDDLFEEENS